MFDLNFDGKRLADIYTNGPQDVVAALLKHPYMEQVPDSNARCRNENAKWRITSGLQKAIRRGEVEAAWNAAYALLDAGYSGPTWKRMCVIAPEEIGYGNLYLVLAVMRISGDSNFRKKIDEYALMYTVVRLLCESVKCRTANDTVVIGSGQFDFIAQVRDNDTEQLVAIARNEEVDIAQRIASMICMSGRRLGKRDYARTNRRGIAKCLIDIERPAIFDAILSAAPGGEALMLAATLILAWDQVKDEPITIVEQPLRNTYTHGLLSSAYDQHCRDGAWAIRVLLKRNKMFEDKLTDLGRDVNVYNAFCMMLFITEGELLDRTLRTDGCYEIEGMCRYSQMTRVGLTVDDMDELKPVVEEMLDDLDGCRDWVAKEERKQAA